MWPSVEGLLWSLGCRIQTCPRPTSSAPAARPLKAQVHLTARQEQVLSESLACPLLVASPQGNQNRIPHNTPKHMISFWGSLGVKDADFFLYDNFSKANSKSILSLSADVNTFLENELKKKNARHSSCFL